MSQHLADELLSARLDGALEPAELEAFTAHLSGCADCGRRLELMRATTRAVADLPGEEPGVLDLSFLPAAPVAPANLVTVPASRWRPPPWAAPLLAAAAVLVVALGVGTVALRRPAATSAGSTALQQQGRLIDGSAIPTDGSSAASGAFGANPGAGGQAPAVPGTADQAAPNRSLTTLPGTTSSHDFPAAGGARVSLSASPARVTRGQGIQVSMSLSAGSSAVEASGLQVVARRGSEAVVVLGSGAQSVPVGRTTTLYGSWVAGQPGDYRLEARVRLTDGSDLTVSLTVNVT